MTDHLPIHETTAFTEYVISVTNRKYISQVLDQMRAIIQEDAHRTNG